MNFDSFILFDGAMGTMLQKRAQNTVEIPELLNLTEPDTVVGVHKDYVLAGADVITTNTFGANSLKMGGKYNVAEIVSAAVKNARLSGAKHIALDVGPTGALLEPLGELSFDDAVKVFSEQISAGVKSGIDCIIIETMSDLLETKAAVIAAKDCCSLPVIASMTFGPDGKTFLGSDAVTATITLCSLGVSAVGANCSVGPESMLPIVSDILKYSTVPVIIQANAGMPVNTDGITSYPCSPHEYNEFIKGIINMGVTVLGGCCGTTPEYTALMRRAIDASEFKKHTVKPYTAFTSGRKSVILTGDKIAVVGERINPSFKENLQEALVEKNYSLAIDEALLQEDRGADLLEINVTSANCEQSVTLTELVKEIQAVCFLPLIIDSADLNALSSAVRIYNGRPVINSVNGKSESLDTILPLAVKYGAAVIALTLDDNGIPKTAEGRLLIAKRILSKALDYGLKKEDVIIDCLTLTALTNQVELIETLKSVKLVKSTLGIRTVLGISNVFFPMPSRKLLNSVFLAAALGAGLDIPILDPLSDEGMRVISAYRVINNEDPGAEALIKKLNN